MTGQDRVLFLSHRLPFPPHNGAAIRTYNILKLLAERFQVTALCFDRQDSALGNMPLSDRVSEIAKLGEVEVFPIPQEGSRVRLLWDHVRSVASGRAYTWYVHESVAFRDRLVGHLESGRFDLVHMDSMDLVYYLPFLTDVPVVCTHHNVESSLMARRGRAEKSALRGRYLSHQARLLELMEKQWLNRVDLNIAVSPEDKELFEKLSPGVRCEVIPNGVDTEEFRPSDIPGSGCVFVGGTSWFPNKDALAWFTQEIQPILDRLPERPLTKWVGRASPEEISTHSDSTLTLTGYVPDIRPYVHQAAVFIAPLRVGGGTRLKILDAWAMGKAVVSTSLGCEGLATRHGENILIADSAEDFGTAITNLIRDPEQRNRIGRTARYTVEGLYSWRKLGQVINQLYEEIMRSPKGGQDDRGPVPFFSEQSDQTSR